MFYKALLILKTSLSISALSCLIAGANMSRSAEIQEFHLSVNVKESFYIHYQFGDCWFAYVKSIDLKLFKDIFVEQCEPLRGDCFVSNAKI